MIIIILLMVLLKERVRISLDPIKIKKCGFSTKKLKREKRDQIHMDKSQIPRWPRWKHLLIVFLFSYFSDIEFVNPQYTLGPNIDFLTVACLRGKILSSSNMKWSVSVVQPVFLIFCQTGKHIF